jgi:hypothetical protein
MGFFTLSEVRLVRARIPVMSNGWLSRATSHLFSKFALLDEFIAALAQVVRC